MKRWHFLLLMTFAFCALRAQSPPVFENVRTQSTVPTGPCTLPNTLVKVTVGSGAGLYQCINDVWIQYSSLSGGAFTGSVTAPVVNAVRYAAGAPSSCTTTSGGALTHQADCAFYQAVDVAVSTHNSVDLVFGNGYWNAFKQWVEPTAGFYNVNIIGTSQNGTFIQELSPIPTKAMFIKTAGSAFFYMRDITWITNANAGSCFDLTGGMDGGEIRNVNCEPGVSTAVSGLDHAAQLGSPSSYAEDFVISNLIISPPYSIGQTFATITGTLTGTALTGLSCGATCGANYNATYATGIVNDPNNYCSASEPTFTVTITSGAISAFNITNAGNCTQLPDFIVMGQLAITYGLKAYVSDSQINYLEPNVGITGTVIYGGNNTLYHAHPTTIQYGLRFDSSSAASAVFDGTECDTIGTACFQFSGIGGGTTIVSTIPYIAGHLPGSSIYQFLAGAANFAFGPQGDLCPGATPTDYHEFIGTTGPVVPGGIGWPAGSSMVGNDHSCTHAGAGTNIDYVPTLAVGSLIGNTNYRQMNGYCTGTATANATNISFTGLGTSSALTCTGTLTSTLGFLAIYPGQLSNLSVRCGTTGVSSLSGVFSVEDRPSGGGAVVTPITLTYGTTTAGTTIEDTTHVYSYAAGDLIQIFFSTQPTDTLANCMVALQY